MTDVIFTFAGGAADTATITKRVCMEGCFARKDEVLFEYRPENAEQSTTTLKLRAPCAGVVHYKPGTEVGSCVKKGTVVCTLTECTHAMAYKGSCSTCLMEVTATEFVPTTHNMPLIRVSKENALIEGEKRQTRCLSARKLVLLVDLDQTILHTTNSKPSFDADEHPDISEFQLSDGITYWTKLRPHTTEFLEKMSELYEMDIITFGDRKYADAIAKIIDPNGKLFGARILSRNESQCLRRKTKNLSALFPAGEEMVAIIDDRPDVWDYSDALLQVRPYKFFNIDDINAPPSSSESRPENPAKELSNDRDKALLHAEKVHRQVHTAFYQLFDSTGQKGDLKEIMTGMCKQVLAGCVIVLSGIVPLGSDPRRSDAYRIATKFGAVVEDVVNEGTTHVIAAKWGTKKVQAAARLGLPVVSPEWLYACMELWEKAPEQQYIITADTSIPIGPNQYKMIISGSNILLSASLQLRSGDQTSSVDKDRIEPSDNVKPELKEDESGSEQTGNDNENAIASEADSSSDESGGQKSKRRRKDGEDDDDQEEDDSDDDLDDMVAALEEQLDR